MSGLVLYENKILIVHKHNKKIIKRPKLDPLYPL